MVEREEKNSKLVVQVFILLNIRLTSKYKWRVTYGKSEKRWCSCVDETVSGSSVTGEVGD